MDKDTLKGKGKDIAGRVERQVGEWTGREDLQGEGAAKQMEGKLQKGVGKVKETGRDLMDKVKKHEDDLHREDIHDENIKERKRRAA